MAAVVVSRTYSLSWIFSQVTDGFSEVTSDWATLPVAGNRMFGLRQAMGSYEFFTRGAGRVYPTHLAVDAPGHPSIHLILDGRGARQMTTSRCWVGEIHKSFRFQRASI